jgi:hypothetical protein
MTSTLVQVPPDRLKGAMAVRDLDVQALAKEADLSAKTVCSILGGRAVSLRTAGKVYRSLADIAVLGEPVTHNRTRPLRRLRVHHVSRRLRVATITP